MAVAVDVEKTENTAELIAIAIIAVVVLYLLYKLVSVGSNTVKDLIDKAKCNLNMKGILTPGKNQWQGHPLSPAEMKGVSDMLDKNGCYSPSPDRMQVWFYDGSYYCATDGHVHNFCGQDLGCLVYHRCSSPPPCPSATGGCPKVPCIIGGEG